MENNPSSANMVAPIGIPSTSSGLISRHRGRLSCVIQRVGLNRALVTTKVIQASCHHMMIA